MSEFTPDTDTRGFLTPEQAAADAADLQASLADLAALVSGQSGLGGLLGQVATFAAHAIPGADGAGVTLLRVDRSDLQVEALAASHPFVSEIDEIQYVTVHEGPCITAGTVNLRSCGRSANHISLIRHTRPGESRRRTGENRPRIAQVDSAVVDAAASRRPLNKEAW